MWEVGGEGEDGEGEEEGGEGVGEDRCIPGTGRVGDKDEEGGDEEEDDDDEKEDDGDEEGGEEEHEQVVAEVDSNDTQDSSVGECLDRWGWLDG